MEKAEKHHTASTPRDTPPDLLRASVVSKRLGVTPPTVYTLVRQGKLPAVVFGTAAGRQCIRFLPEDVDQFINANYRGKRATG